MSNELFEQESIVEKCPMFLMDGNRIVEVLYGNWESRDGGFSWDLVERVVSPQVGRADGLVVELPSGCVQAHGIDILEGTLTLRPKGDTDDVNTWLSWSQCHRPRQWIQEPAPEQIKSRLFSLLRRKVQ